jgi:hypothetical protein
MIKKHIAKMLVTLRTVFDSTTVLPPSTASPRQAAAFRDADWRTGRSHDRIVTPARPSLLSRTRPEM